MRTLHWVIFGIYVDDGSVTMINCSLKQVTEAIWAEDGDFIMRYSVIKIMGNIMDHWQLQMINFHGIV